MTAAVESLLQSFEALTDTEKRGVLAELLRRAPAAWPGDLPDEALGSAADELFCALDEAELASDGQLRIEPVAADDDLADDLIANNADFQALLARSAAAPRKPFVPSAPPEDTSESE